jgi:hypothetical protein
MTSIKGSGPMTPSTVTPSTVETPAAATPVKEPEAAQKAHDGFEQGGVQHGAAAVQQNTPVTGSVVSGLALIASLRKHPLFGTGARTKPLKPGEQSLGDHELDPTLLAVDLAGELEQDLADPGSDQHRRAAIVALFASYPGGRDALSPIVP